MNQCWPEGALRAYLDGELSPQDMQSVAAHLDECAACERLHKELSTRAAFVAGLWDRLEPIPGISPRPVRRPAAGSWRWTAAAVALAAGLAIATVLIPKPEANRPAVAVTAPVAVPPPPQPAVPVTIGTEAVPVPVRARVAVTRKPRRPAIVPEPFLALDDDPIESGIVMRVTVPGSAPADVVFSPDGRARAIRLVSGTQRNF